MISACAAAAISISAAKAAERDRRAQLHAKRAAGDELIAHCEALEQRLELEAAVQFQDML